MAGNWSFVIEQGSSFAVTVTVKKNGELLDLTGYTAKYQARPKAGSSTLYFELTDTAGLTLGDAAGTVDFLIDAADTADFTFTSGNGDLVLTAPDGFVLPRLYTHFTVRPATTL